MRVLVDALPARDGGGIMYLIEEIRAMEAIASDVEFQLLVAPWSYERVSYSLRSVVRRVPVRTVADRFAFEQTVLRRRAARWDVLYCPLNFGPMFFGGERALLTLHNSNYFAEGLAVTGTEKARPWTKVKACHAAIRACSSVVAISESLRQSVSSTLPSVTAKLHVVKSGRPDWSTVRPEPMEGIPHRFLLAVGSAAAHKRLAHVVEGWARAVREAGVKISLVIVGGLSESAKEDHRKISGSSAHLLFQIGCLENRCNLRWLYEHATAMISMSVLEAFPLTVVEAGELGCPLVLSGIAAHREVSLGNAVFVQPESPNDLARSLPGTFSGQPGSRPWTWPVTWEDHGMAMLRLLEEVAR